MTDSPTDPSPAGARRAALGFIFVTVVLDMLALGIIIPVMPKLVESFVGGDTATAAWVFGFFGTAWALMQFVFSPLIGALSDRFGRRPVILFSNLGTGLDYILMALAPTLTLLFIGRVISGITTANIPTAFAYIADVTKPEDRAKAFGLIGAAFGAGFVLGPAIGGLLAGFGPRTPFWVAAAFSLANAAYGAFVLPESLKKENRSPFDWRKASWLGSVQLLRTSRALKGLAFTNFLGVLAHNVLPTVFVLYAGYRYGWDEKTVGLTLAGVGICFALVQAVITGRVVAWIGERTTMIVGLIFGAIGFAAYGLAPTSIWFWVSIPVMSLWGLAGPSAQGIMSRLVSASEQGQLQGANNSIGGIANLIGPGIFSAVFAYSIGAGLSWGTPGLAFVLAGVLLAISTVVAWQATRERAA